MSKWMRWFLLAAILLLPSAAWAQCTGGLISGCPAAFSPQPNDLAFVWQNGQTPHTRAATFAEIANVGLTPQMTVKLNTLQSGSAGAGFNLGLGTPPSSCIAGDVWETTLGLFTCPTNANPVGPLGGGGSSSTAVYANASLLPPVSAANNGTQGFVQNCQNGSQSGGAATGCLYIVNTAGAWTAQPNPSNLTMTIGGQVLYLGGVTSNQGNGSKLQLANGAFVVGHALAYDNNGNAVDSGVPPSGGTGGSGTVTASPQNSIPFYSNSGSSAVVSGMSIVNNAVLSTNGSGVPSESTTLPTGMTIPSPVISNGTFSGTTSIASAAYTGKQTFVASNTGGASINLPPGVAPTSPVNGDIWETTNGFFGQFQGTTAGPLLATVSGTTPIVISGGGTPFLTATCPSCARTTNGGVLTATAPITISAGGLIALGLQPMPITWIADNATIVHNDTYNFIEKWVYTNSGTINNFVYHTGGSSTPSFVASLQINGTPITGCNSISVTSGTDATATCTAANTITNGQTLSMVISGTTGSPSSAVIQVNASRPAS